MDTNYMDPNDLLAGGGGKYFKFEAIGDKVSGEIVSYRSEVETEYGTSEPKKWSTGKPRYMLVLQVQTDERTDAEDDGIRNVYLKGLSNLPGTGIAALAEAMKKAGAKKLEEGAQVAIAYSGDAEPYKPGYRPAKQFTAAYKRPAAGADLSDLLG